MVDALPRGALREHAGIVYSETRTYEKLNTTVLCLNVALIRPII